MIEEKLITCSECGKPARIIHDLDMTECCHAQIKKDEPKIRHYPTARPYPIE